jgi:hypothetical protein
LQWRATCVDQPALDGKRFSLQRTTVLTGALHGKGYERRVVYTVSVRKGWKAKHTANARFALTGRRLKGSFALTAVIYSRPGVVAATCATPKIAFQASLGASLT